MRIPLNRVVAFAGPYIALASSGVAAWLIAKVNVLGIPGLDEHNVATWLAAALTGGLVAGLHALGGWSWLKGHHIELAGYANAQAAALAATGELPGNTEGVKADGFEPVPETAPSPAPPTLPPAQ